MCNYVEDTHTFTMETTPEEFIDLMYDNLNEDGVTFIPGPYDDSKYLGGTFSYRCRIAWDNNGRKEAQKKFASLFDALKKIAEYDDKLDGTNENAKKVLGDGELFYIWATYVKAFSTDN